MGRPTLSAMGSDANTAAASAVDTGMMNTGTSRTNTGNTSTGTTDADTAGTGTAGTGTASTDSASEQPVAAFLVKVTAAAREGSLLGLTLSKPREEAVRTTVRPVTVGGERRFQIQWLDGPQSRQKNVTADELSRLLQADVPARFRHSHAFTAAADLSLLVGKRGRATLQRRRPSKTADADAPHDRGKRYLIPEGTPNAALHAAGVMTADGRVPKAKRAKFRQINRVLELVNDVLPSLSKHEGRPLRVVEFGSGKSHLTFALHHLLTAGGGRPVELLSVDRNEAVVRDAEETTRRLGLIGITHRAANIADVPLPEGTDLALWLHACDTATDDAIARSVRAGVPVILAVPCCQHELNASLTSESLLFEYGLLRERAAAIATDALRAAALERLGYRTQVAEFVDLEHTAKNVLIRAVRREAAPTTDGAEPTAGGRAATRYHQLKALLGIESWHLERLLPELAE